MGPAEEEDVFVVAIGNCGSFEDADGESVRGVWAVAFEPLGEEWVAGETEVAFGEDREVFWGFAHHTELVVVLEVGADAWQVDDDGDVEFFKF
jgi:hypothetical protein